MQFSGADDEDWDQEAEWDTKVDCELRIALCESLLRTGHAEEAFSSAKELVRIVEDDSPAPEDPTTELRLKALSYLLYARTCVKAGLFQTGASACQEGLACNSTMIKQLDAVEGQPVFANELETQL